MENIRVIMWGLGAMGSGMARDLLTNRKGVEIVGVIGSNPAKLGKDLGEALGLERRLGITVSGDPAEVLRTKADIVLLATASFAREVLPQLRLAVEAGKNVVTIAEEMAAPQAQHPDIAAELDALAQKHGVTILGTGVNPGFVLDTLIVTLTGACQQVRKITAARINDLSPFGPTVMKTQGVGSTVEEFDAGVKSGAIVGHIGFQESIYLIAAALSWKLDRVAESREPIVSTVEDRKSVV